MTTLNEYRAYVLDSNDHVVARHDIEADNGTAALELAKQYVDGHDVEVWQRTHIIGRLRHKKPVIFERHEQNGPDTNDLPG
jgi:hypothetical protein